MKSPAVLCWVEVIFLQSDHLGNVDVSLLSTHAGDSRRFYYLSSKKPLAAAAVIEDDAGEDNTAWGTVPATGVDCVHSKDN